MHQNAANGVVHWPPVLIFSHVGLMKDANGLKLIAPERELGGVVQHQDGRAAGCHSVAGGLKVPSQNLFFAYSTFAKKRYAALVLAQS